MADYRSIDDSEVDPDAPVTSDLAYALRDNPIAIAEGASGAPRVQMAAFPRLVEGSVIKFDRSITGTITEQALAFGFVQFGTVRLNISGSNIERLVVRRRNGSSSTQYSGTGTSAIVDISVRPGDRVDCSVVTVGINTTAWSWRTNGVDIVPCSNDWHGYMDPNAAP